MAKIKLSAKAGKGAAKKRAQPNLQPLKLSLPLNADPLSEDLRDYSILVHGEKKIGKTSLFAQEEDAFFLEFDPKQKALEILQRHCPDWRTFLGYLDLLEKVAGTEACPYRTVIVDGADLMYREAFKFICKKLAISHPNEMNDFGASWDAIRQEFHNGVTRLLNLPGISTRFITHSKWKEVKTRDKTSLEKLVPLLPSQAEETLVGLVDIWAAYCYDGTERVLVIAGDETTGAGHRVDHRFRTPFDNQPISEIWMGRSPQEGYQNLINAFQGIQTYSTMEGWREQQAAEANKKKGGRTVLKKKKRFIVKK